MTDKELLELAAKAASYKLVQGNGIPQERDLYIESFDADGFVSYPHWNPLEKDGDALRLAVKLQMHMIIGEYIVYVRWMGCSQEIVERATMGYSIEEATRRAIVRAAAAIGESM